jgi:hypothetical protein
MDPIPMNSIKCVLLLCSLLCALAAPMRAVAAADGQPAGTDPSGSGQEGPKVNPTLLLKGSLEGTPAEAARCRPLEIRYRTWRDGAVQPDSGTLRLEIRSRVLRQSVYAVQLPLLFDEKTTRIENVDFPRGAYTVSLRAFAANHQYGLTSDLVLAEQSLTIADPVRVTRSTNPIPRILIWSGTGKSFDIERALVDKMMNDAFAQDKAYMVFVSSAEDFARRALTGMFNEYVLIDIDETLDASDAIANGLSRGAGVVIAGSGERSRFMAERFGFLFEPVSGAGAARVTIPATSTLGLSGTLPLSGSAFVPSRKTGRALASYGNGSPSILLDTIDRGRMLVLSFSLTKSALDSGITDAYTRLLRKSILATLPGRGEQNSVASVTLAVSSSTGPVPARITEELPAGSEVLWSNVKGQEGANSLTFELVAQQQPATLQYLFRPAAGGTRKTVSTVSSVCEGKLMLQGKVE